MTKREKYLLLIIILLFVIIFTLLYNKNALSQVDSASKKIRNVSNSLNN